MAGIAETFQAFSGILVVCPCCGELLALAELKLRYKGRLERTILDELRKKEKAVEMEERRVQNLEASFDQMERTLRDEAARKGRAVLKQKLQEEEPLLSKLGYDPQDVKAIGHPVNLIVFDGLNSGRVRNVILIAQAAVQVGREIKASIRHALKEGRCVWRTVKVKEDGHVEVC